MSSLAGCDQNAWGRCDARVARVALDVIRRAHGHSRRLTLRCVGFTLMDAPEFAQDCMI